MQHLSNAVTFFVIMLCWAAVPGRVTADSLVGAPNYPLLLSQRLSGIESLHGDFQQQSEGDFNTLYKGQIWIARPYLFRVDTIDPSMQSLVSDGQDLWSYDEDLEQVIISKLNKDLSEVPILLFGSDIDSIEAAYTISGYSDEGQDYFLLEPNSDISLFRSLLLEFDGETPSSIRINAATGEQTIISLANMVLNEKIKKDFFTFSVPVEVDIIDER